MRSLTIPVFLFLAVYGTILFYAGFHEAKRRYKKVHIGYLHPMGMHPTRNGLMLQSNDPHEFKFWEIIPRTNVIDWEKLGWA